MDTEGEIFSQISGKLWFARGGRFRAEYAPPEPLLVVSDGETLWTYEPELNQAIVRPLATIGGSFLLALSAAEWGELRRNYRFAAALSEDDEGIRWVQAESRAQQSSVRAIRFGFAKNNQLQKLQMQDAFGGTVQIQINEFTKGADDSVFVFAPPPGTDIVSDQ